MLPIYFEFKFVLNLFFSLFCIVTQLETTSCLSNKSFDFMHLDVDNLPYYSTISLSPINRSLCSFLDYRVDSIDFYRLKFLHIFCQFIFRSFFQHHIFFGCDIFKIQHQMMFFDQLLIKSKDSLVRRQVDQLKNLLRSINFYSIISHLT